MTPITERDPDDVLPDPDDHPDTPVPDADEMYPREPSAGVEYRWDLHHLRERNREQPRCMAVHGEHRCEYIEHGGKAHASLDGSLVWGDTEDES